MDDSLIDILIFAPLAPICGVLLFWFIQLLFIESQKYLLSKIKHRHEALCRFTNFLGIFFQTLCHALGYTVTGSGIAEFYLSVDYGKVSPRKKKTGFFEWFSNGFLFLGPFFIPPLLLLLCLIFLMNNGLGFIPQHGYSFSQELIDFGANLYLFSNSFLGFLVSMDLFHPGHIGFLILFLFLGLGIRPSYIRDERREERIDMLYDLRNIKNHLLHRPLYVLLFFIASYIFFYISFFFKLNWYTAFFSLLGRLSIIAIISLLVTHLLLILIRITDKIEGVIRLVPYITMIPSYVSLRVLFLLLPIPYATTFALIGMCIITGVAAILILRRQTNKFKTSSMMDSLYLEEGDADG
ncbi:MAG TPA: hypothetical protein ENG62_03475 [Thermoplasmatales archaeon]|nr:hypothetical protein [Thermoplasmatales archaeon]